MGFEIHHDLCRILQVDTCVSSLLLRRKTKIHWRVSYESSPLHVASHLDIISSLIKPFGVFRKDNKYDDGHFSSLPTCKRGDIDECIFDSTVAHDDCYYEYDETPLPIIEQQ